MSHDTDTIRSAAAYAAAAPLDLLLTDIAVDPLRRMNPGGSGPAPGRGAGQQAPSNNPLLNPAALKAAIDTGGGSALAGLQHSLADMAARVR